VIPGSFVSEQPSWAVSAVVLQHLLGEKREFGECDKAFSHAQIVHSIRNGARLIEHPPVFFKPPNSGGKGLAARIEWRQHGTSNERKIGRPAAIPGGLDA